MNNYQGLRINQKTVAIPLRTKNYSVKICDKKMLQDEDQDSRQILRPRSRPIPRPLQLQSCSINNNNKLSRIFSTTLQDSTSFGLWFQTPHPLVLYSTISLFIY